MSDANAATVLIADDDPDIRELVAYRMRRSGYAVLEASDGEEALQIASENDPDLAILDVMMPRLDGFEVTRRLRDQEKTARISCHRWLRLMRTIRSLWAMPRGST